MLKIGKLRHRITIQQATETQDGAGQPIPSWSTFATVWASVEPLQGKEYLLAQQTKANVSHKVTIRHLDGVIPKMRISYDSRTLQIVSVIHSEERDFVTTLMCVEQV